MAGRAGGPSRAYMRQFRSAQVAKGPHGGPRNGGKTGGRGGLCTSRSPSQVGTAGAQLLFPSN
eukprot:13470563-Alexandrium_andersonii.AAC.1